MAYNKTGLFILTILTILIMIKCFFNSATRPKSGESKGLQYDQYAVRNKFLSSSDILRFQEGYKSGNKPLEMNDPRLLEYIRAMIHGPSYLPSTLGSPECTDFSQAKQSQVIDKILHGQRGGFFVECGASNGESLSNSLYFERERNWTGLLIEANPGLYSQILHKNRKSYSINACLSPSNQPQLLKFQTELEWMGGLAEFGHGANKDHFKSAKSTAEKHIVNIQCFPLFSILEAMGVRHVHYLSLDVEGPELEVLDTIPWNKLRIDTLTVEYSMFDGKSKNVDLAKKKLAQIREFFKKTGLYEEVSILSLRQNNKDQEALEDYGLDIVLKRSDLK